MEWSQNSGWVSDMTANYFPNTYVCLIDSHRKKKELKKKNHVMGNRLYNAKSVIDMSQPRHMNRFAQPRKKSKKGKKRTKKTRPRDGASDSDSPFAPGRPFTGEVVRVNTSGFTSSY